MEIRLITPIVGDVEFDLEPLQRVLRPDSKLTVVQITRGPASIECEYDEALAVPDTVRLIVEAEQQGADAAVINCMGDPGLKPAREKVRIPVLGPAESSMHLASVLAHKFSIVTVLDRIIPIAEDLAAIYGVREKMASVRSVEIPVLDLEKDREQMVRRLAEESAKAIEEDGAHIIIFGCTGMTGFAEAVESRLREMGYADVPVMDPLVAAVKLAEALVDLNLSHSKQTYPFPPAKKIVGY